MMKTIPQVLYKNGVRYALIHREQRVIVYKQSTIEKSNI